MLADCGNITMPLGDTFWAEGFGMVTDRFGMPWRVSDCPSRNRDAYFIGAT